MILIYVLQLFWELVVLLLSASVLGAPCRSSAGKALWGLTVFTLLLVCMALAGQSLTHILSNPLVRTTSLGPIPVDGSLPFPAVTVCPVQLNDKWNLLRALLNDYRISGKDASRNRLPGAYQVEMFSNF